MEYKSFMESYKSTIIIIPHAGGASHLYQTFANQLQENCRVYLYDLPGHGRRSKECLMESMEDVVEDLMKKIDFIENENWAVFGHSMGSHIAHALLRKRFNCGLSLPSCFFVSGTPSPVNRISENISDLSGDRFWLRLSDFGAIPDDILHNNEFRSFFEVILRKDMKIVDKYKPDTLKLPVPVHVFYGTDDMTEKSSLSWSQDSDYPVVQHPFQGDHFYLFKCCNDICAIMKKEILKQISQICR